MKIQLLKSAKTSGWLGKWAIIVGMGISFLLLGLFCDNTNPTSTVPVTGVTVQDTASVLLGATKQLTAAIIPSNATNQGLLWTSGDSLVATVTQTGLVTGINTGSSIIMVKTKDGGFTAQCSVRVFIVSITGITISSSEVVEKGTTKQLIATITPVNATNQNLRWISTDSSIATVSSTGLVTGITPGATTITVSDDYWFGINVYCKITVPLHATGVSCSSFVSVEKGKVKQISVSIIPGNATNQDLVWKSSNGLVATAYGLEAGDAWGNIYGTGMVYGNEVGNSVLTVTTVDGNYKAQCSVLVTNSATDIETGTMTDIEGNVYKTVKMGTQEWMAENLRTTKYNDGTSIPLDTSPEAWTNAITPKYCFYNNTTNADSIKKIGALYNGYVVDTKKLAPAGWHVPATGDWDILEHYLAENGYDWTPQSTNGLAPRSGIAKSLASTTGWDTCSRYGAIGNDMTKNNGSGFSAIPAGSLHLGFWGIGKGTTFWTATNILSNTDELYRCYLEFEYEFLGCSKTHKGVGCSVRLVRD